MSANATEIPSKYSRSVDLSNTLSTTRWLVCFSDGTAAGGSALSVWVFSEGRREVSACVNDEFVNGEGIWPISQAFQLKIKAGRRCKRGESRGGGVATQRSEVVSDLYRVIEQPRIPPIKLEQRVSLRTSQEQPSAFVGLVAGRAMDDLSEE
ncbi:hypothetical protein RRG08_011093 [Elysia crispata]|uniref:Uncharacterized protein n=1 Tax=Elysia crispata TaxID=231223 RepID=A0AAE0Z8W6_9GAST|nr:hypothetical protein RRG08_011093 [Elysia crispata]